MNGLLVGGVIGEGLKSFVNSYNATQDRQRQQAESDETRALRRRQMEREEEESKASSGMKLRETKLREAQEGLEYDDAAGKYKQVGKPLWQQKKDYDHGLIQERNKSSRGLLTPQQKYDTEKYNQAAQIPNMQLKQGFRPPEKTVEELRSQKTTVDLMNSTIDKLDSAIGKYGTRLLPGEENALMGSLITDLQLRAKEFQKLGVLNGPDLQLMIKQFGDPTSVKGKLLGPEALKVKLKQMKALINNGFKQTAVNAGFDVNMPDFADPQIKTGPNPGDIEDGYEFKGGDPRDRKNWAPANTARNR